MGSLLATRCEAYKVLYDQLVRHVGQEGRGGGGGGPPCLIFNTNTNAVDACPVTNNTNGARAEARALAANKGLGAAALAAALVGAALLARALLGARRGAGGGELRRAPRGRGGREMALVSALSACGDELRKANKNESLLQDDWRIGRLRLGWPVSPVPPGYAPLSAEVCDITGTLQGIYGH